MSFDWLRWSNPVSLWWGFLVCISFLNICFWFWTKKYLKDKSIEQTKSNFWTEVVVWLSMAYVLGCAFRSFFPRADVQRICLFDTWLSSVFWGRSAATLAELAFVAQWAIVLNQVSKIVQLPVVEKISKLIVPLIFVAECFSWYSVIIMSYLGNFIEESIWTITYMLILICLLILISKFKGAFKTALQLTIAGIALYVLFMVLVDVPMYWGRFQDDTTNGKVLLGLASGLHDIQNRWVVAHDIDRWKEEIPWMSLYFTVAVWTSLALCYVPLNKEKLSKYLK